MAIDFSYLEGAASQNENTATQTDAANVTIRVDADSLLLCDGDYIDHPFKAGVLTKIQLPIGQHLLEFLYTEDPDIKIEKEVDFPEAGKSYLVLIKGLKDLVDAAAEEVRRKAEEETKRKAAEEAARKKAEAKRKADEAARRKTEAEAEAKRKAEAEKKAEIKRIVELADDYYYGRNGKSKDYEKAAANFLIAAKAGDAYSQYSLGWCYENGQGVEQSAQEAVKWYRKAAAQGESKAKERLTDAEKKAKEEEKRFINGHKFIDLGLPSGLKWATCNVGASSPEECGDYYAWGEVETKSSYTECDSVTSHKKMSDISGNRTYDVARKKWGSSWRLPTYDEFDELVSFCKWKEDTQGGMKGYKGIGPNGNSIFLPAAGRCESLTRTCQDDCCYWSSTPVEGHLYQTPEHAKHLFANNLTIDSFWGSKVMYTSREFGLNVRPVSK